jgi:hypothetical protein
LWSGSGNSSKKDRDGGGKWFWYRKGQGGEYDFSTADDSSGADQDKAVMKGKMVNITLGSVREEAFSADIKPRRMIPF